MLVDKPADYCPLIKFPYPAFLSSKKVPIPPKFPCSWFGLLPCSSSCTTPSADTHSHVGIQVWRMEMVYLPNIREAMGRHPSVSSDHLMPFCVQTKTRWQTILKSCVQAAKLSEERDSTPPIHVWPVSGEHEASCITWGLTTRQNFLTHERALDSPTFIAFFWTPQHGIPGGFMLSKHWAARGV